MARKNIGREIRKLFDGDNTETCAVCKRNTRAYRWICKRGETLQRGFYRPQLTMDEMYKLREGESPVCVDRRACARHKQTKPAPAKE